MSVTVVILGIAMGGTSEVFRVDEALAKAPELLAEQVKKD